MEIKIKEQKLKERKRFDPLNDFLFYKIMGEKGSETQLLGFINAVLGRTENNRFTSIEILENKTFTPEAIGDKQTVLDVRAELSDLSKVNVEVQLRNQHNMNKRSLYYWSREYSKSLLTGQDYNELPKVIAINIVNFNYPPTSGFHSCFRLKEDKEPEIILTDSLEIHFLNMVKYRKQGKDALNNPLERWLAWFNQISQPELAEEAAKMDAAIQAANERMVYVTGDADAIWAYERRQMALSDHTSQMNYARSEGFKEGHEDGFKQGHEEGIEKGIEKEREYVLQLLDQGLSVDEIKQHLEQGNQGLGAGD